MTETSCVARTGKGAVRFAMIGAGKHATNAIYPSLRHSRLDLVALADLDRERGESVAKRFGAKRVYTRHHDLLAREDVELVGVVGPPRMHVEVGLEVLASGRHLFIEKPPGETLEEARRLQDAARAAGKQLMVGFMKRFASAYRRAKLISTTDSFGSPSVLRLNYSHWQYEHLRSHLLYMSTHALDLARFFMGEVAGGTAYKRAMGMGMIVSLMLEHVNGGLSQLTLSSLEPRIQESIDLSGDNTLIQVRNLSELRYYKRAAGAELTATTEEMASLWHPDLTIALPHNDSLVLQGYAGELKHLADCIDSGQAVEPSIDDGIEAMRLVEAIIAAPEGMSVLELPD